MHPEPKKVMAIFILAIAIIAPANVAWFRSNQSPDIQLAVKAGYDGKYKGEFWMPVQVNLVNSGPSLEGSIQITGNAPAGRQNVIYRTPVSLPNLSRKRVTLHVHLPEYSNKVLVELVDNQGRSVISGESDILDKLAVGDWLIGVVTPEKGRFDALADLPRGQNESIVAYLELDEIASTAPALNALDAIVFHDVDTGRLTISQIEAIKAWLSSGGQVIVLGGSGGQKTAAGLVDQIPVTVHGVGSIQDLPALEIGTGNTLSDAGPFVVSSVTLKDGEKILEEEGVTLLAKRAYGRGAIHFLAIDPSARPFDSWEDQGYLWSLIFGETSQAEPWAAGARSSYSAASAVSTLPTLKLPSTLALLFYLLIYVAAIGPLNYLVLRRLKRLELAWITIPVLIIVFSAAAYVVGFRLKGNRAIVNEMSIAYGHIDGDYLRVQSLFGLYSPRRSSYEVSFPDHSLARPFGQDLLSPPVNSMVNSGSGGEKVTLSDVRVDVGDVETFVADSYQLPAAVEGRVILQPDADEYRLAYSIHNGSDFTLEKALLLIGQYSISIGDLEPGESISQDHTLTADTVKRAFGSPSGTSSFSQPPRLVASPLAVNYVALLGTPNFISDTEVYPRWQLLQSLEPGFDLESAGTAQTVATLVAWSDESQIDVALEDRTFDRQSTTLYFIEIPVNIEAVTGQRITLPNQFLKWRVLNEQGVTDPSAENLYLQTGWVEFEFQPIDDLLPLHRPGLAVTLTESAAGTGQPPPSLFLWDWIDGKWVLIEETDWGSNIVEEADNFVGHGNAIRLRLQNDGAAEVILKEIYLSLSGSVE